MAKRKGKKGKKQNGFYPVVRHLRYQLTNSPTGGTETSHFVDLARDLSAVNRRLYKQGMYYSVRKITVTSRDTYGGLFTVGVAPTSWVTRNAWRKARGIWNDMNDQVENADSIKGKWADFKVYLSDDHRTGTVLDPIDNGNNAVGATNRDWEYSLYESPDGTAGSDSFVAHLLGADSGSAGAITSAGIVDGYENSRVTVQESPDSTPINSDSWMMNVLDDGTTFDEIVVDLTNQNDNPPYDRDDYCGGQGNMPKPIVVQMGALGLDQVPTDTSLSLTLGGFTAMCGLLEFETQSSVDNDVFDVLIELSAGDYRGVKAEAI